MTGFAHYRDKLSAAKVMLDAAERRKRIGFETARLAWEAGLEVKVDRTLYKLVPVQETQDVAGSKGQALKQRR